MVLPFFGKKPTSSTPAATSVPGAPGAPEPQPPELSTLDFSAGDASHALQHFAGQVEVQEMTAGIGAVYEEAAVLFANGNTAEAEAVLNAVLDGQTSGVGEGLWMMLLDLYRLTGQRQRFETRVLDYATRFERSPPPWSDLSSSPERPRSNASPLVNLSGSLSGQAAAQFEQMAIIGKKSGAIRIDLGRVRSFDETGCTLFRRTLAELAAERVKVSLLKCGDVADMLAAQVCLGQPAGRDVWLLLLEMLQNLGDQERFENMAVDYAVTFEESPPSWDPRSEQAASATSVQEVALDLDAPAAGDFTLEGELTSTGVEKIRKLAAHASALQKVEVDCGQLRRIDFVSAGTLFNILATLQAQGKQVVLRNVNAMVAALLRVMGVDQVATVLLRS